MPDLQILDAAWGATITNDVGEFNVGAMETVYKGQPFHHLFIYRNLISPVPLRIQSACALGHIAGDHECDCCAQMTDAMHTLNRLDNGLIIYTEEHDGRGRGLVSKVRVYAERQQHNLSSREACTRLGLTYDLRDFGQIAEILKHLEIADVYLLSDSAEKKAALESRGIKTHAMKPI
ncbi:hypothetical protein [Pseudomonas sp. B21-053]|uniref:hypothetical protein n=1 Tax=Pseudomonas sp. B21-053 TaxID=2895493 RepID=UPI00223250D8|nr:hypothetical protein [Pseudomonas sp. B21-053]UZE14421.1 hypothetical protein LOY68_12725 [Pseudomonas sp. B21-053]